MNKFLFLDVDGVLNNYQYYEKMFKTYPAAKRNALTDEDRALIDFDPENVAQLERIVQTVPDLQIVISSTWRRLHTLAEIRGYILKKGGTKASSIIIDKTPYIPELLKIRGQEIKWWLDNYADTPDFQYVILDDDSDMLPEQKAGHFVQTHHFGGLTAENADQAIAIYS